MPSVLYIADRGMPSFQAAPLSVDVVCVGDSITGWNNFGSVRDWPYRTYPEFLQRATAAGTIAYWVFMAGKKVIYFGRKGESHVEDFRKTWRRTGTYLRPVQHV